MPATPDSPLDRRYERPAAEQWPVDPESWPVPIRQRKSLELLWDGDLLVVYDTKGFWIEVNAGEGGKWQWPVSYQALVNRSGLPLCQLLIEATVAGPVCRQLTLVDDPLTATRSRVPLAELVIEATRMVGQHGRDSTEEPYEPDKFLRALAEVTARPQLGHRLSDEWLARVADVYREALRRGLPATDMVAEAFPISRSTAGRWVMEARRRGLLGPAVPGRAGEQEAPNRGKK